MNTDRTLGIIIIGKNEGNIIRRVFISVLMARDKYVKAFNITPEIIYIDSNSTDNSIEIAKELNIPFSIIRGRTSPAIARNFGLQRLNTRYVFFLDGDTEVQDNWLVQAVDYLENNSNISGVGGILEFVVYEKGRVIWRDKNYRHNKFEGEPIYDGVGGTFLYKLKDILEIKGFNENYRNNEEFDLMVRLAYNGKTIVRINKPMAVHHDYKSVGENYIKRYLFTRNIFVSGVVIRNLPKNLRSLKIIFYRYWLYFIHIPLIFIFLFFSFTTQIIAYFIAILIFLLHCLYKRFNFKRVLVSLISINFYSFGLYYGYFFIKQNDGR